MAPTRRRTEWHVRWVYICIKRLTKVVLKSTKCSSAMQWDQNKITLQISQRKGHTQRIIQEQCNLHTYARTIPITYIIHQSILIFRQVEKYDCYSFRWKLSSDRHVYIVDTLHICMSEFRTPVVNTTAFHFSSPNLLNS